jgi:CHAT domain-containing protein
LLDAGKRAMFTEGARKALPDIKAALKVYQTTGNRRGEALALGYLGYGYRTLGNYIKAIQYFEQSLRIKRLIGDQREEGKTLVNLALTLWDQSNYDQAIRENTKALEIARRIPDPQIEAAALNGLGLCHDEVGDFGKSLDEYRQALRINRSIGFVRGETDVLGNLGGRYMLLGRYRDALPYYQDALKLDEQENLKPSMSLDMGNMALCFAALGRTQDAFAAYDRALVLARDAGLQKEQSDWHRGKGNTLLGAGKYDAALAEYRLAARVYERAGNRREFVEALQELGKLHMILGDQGSANTEFRRSMEIARAIGHPRGVTASLLALGGIESRRQRYASAETFYAKAAARARRANNQEQLALSLAEISLNESHLSRPDQARHAAQESLELARHNGTRLLESRAMYALGEAERSAGRFDAALEDYRAGADIARAAGDPELGWRFGYAKGQSFEALKRWDEAVREYERTALLIESVRSQLREERFRAGYIEGKEEVYVALVRLLLKLGRIKEAFQYSERLRAQNYASLLGHVTPRAQQDSEREVRERIRRLERSIDEENARPRSEQRATRTEAYSAELAEAERSYQNLLDDLRASDPDFAAARAIATPTADELQRRLPNGTALLEYVAAEEGLSLFIITRRELRAISVPVRRSELEAKVELLRDLMTRQDSIDWRRPAATLRRALIEPAETAGMLRSVNQLYIVPHGILHYLPFAALINDRGRYLIEDYSITCLPAGALLASGTVMEGSRTVLVAAPLLSTLPYTGAEARSIKELFPQGTEVLLGSDATETSFKSRAGRYRILHLATHAYLNRINPLLSGLQLQSDNKNDGRLEVHEILDLRLKARLVTLSACETALGGGYFSDVPAGDEFVSLTRAFLRAGTPSVLATLWHVNDGSTLQLMRGFYRAFASRGASGALAEAQRAAIHSRGRYREPYFWAPFVLVGQSQ